MGSRVKPLTHWAGVMGLLCGAALLAAPQMEAQRWGRPRVPRAGACFYRDAYFRGDYFCVDAGRDYRYVPADMNDEISSIRLFGSSRVTVYQDRSFRGRSREFRNDVRNLRNEGWNDRLSSLRVHSGRGRDRDDDRRDRDDRGGRHGTDRGGSQHGDVDGIIRRAYEDMLGRQADAAGLRLYRSRMIDDGWSERQVRDALRDSPEYRERNSMTRAKAEEIVRRAYLSVLRREPDSGSRRYVDKVLRDHWTSQDVESDLRKSPEYRGRH